MLRPKVFVSYSHKDKKALEQLHRFLRPLERDGLLAIWADTGLEEGDDWKREIDEALAAATVAVLLISQDFLASDFIVKDELPPVLEREAAGLLTVLPVFLGPSQVKTLGFPDPRSGGRDKVFLTKFQGFGLPDKPLTDRTWSERDKIFLKLSERLRALAGSPLAVPAPDPQPVVSPVVRIPSGPSQVYELTVQLEARRESLLVTYHLPGQEPIGSVSVPTAEVWGRIAPIHEALDDDNSLRLLAHLGSSLDGWGDLLFDILFGGADRWEPIFRAVFSRPAGTPRPSPIFGEVRLRIHAEDSRLSGLPWRLTAWQGQPLLENGWVFSTTHSLDPTEDVLTLAPSKVLIVAPQLSGNGGGPHDPEHTRAVLDVLEKVWPTGRDPGYVQVAHTRAEIERALRTLQPQIFYFYGRGSVAGGWPSLSVEGSQGADALALADLARLFKVTGHTPAVVYLNTEGLNEGSGDSPRPTPDRILGTEVHLLVWRRRPEWSVDSSSTALQWLFRWLAKGEDPVAAFHQIHRIAASCEACSVAVHSNYRTWRTALYQGQRQTHYPLLRLDRDRPKAQVRKHLEELVGSGTRRVMALVSYGAAGNSLESFWRQLQHDLESSALSHTLEIQWIALQVPLGRSRLRQDMEEELKLQLGAQPNEPVTYLLRRHAPRATSPNRRPVLWLNWGTFGEAAGFQDRLTDDQLEVWLRFSSEFLASQCPTDLHIVSFAALEVPDLEHKRFSGMLQELRKQPWCRTPAFRLSEVPPLGEVAESDLLDFLEEPANSSCDPGIQQEVAERIIALTRGAFDKTVTLLQEAESGSWYDLLARFRLEQENKTSR